MALRLQNPLDNDLILHLPQDGIRFVFDAVLERLKVMYPIMLISDMIERAYLIRITFSNVFPLIFDLLFFSFFFTADRSF